MTVLWCVARGVPFERGGFALHVVQGDSVQGQQLCVVFTGIWRWGKEKGKKSFQDISEGQSN